MQLNTLKITTILKESRQYPSLLKEIPNPPSKIFVLGKFPADPPVGGLKIAIVGTRKATLEGRLIAKKIAQRLAELKIVVVSGLAMGIDTAAHEGALAGNGETIAVLACGLNTIYPRQNENLAKKIIESGGAIVSEYPTGTPILPHQFLERNRIVSGLSVATIVIEAPIDSGALVTARLAAEQGREVFIFPGPINHPNYRGSHKLIRDGARLVASIEDILEDLGLENPKSKIRNTKQIINSEIQNIKDENQLLVFKTIQEAGKSLNIDKIIELTKLEPQIANQAIAILIINSFIKETEHGYSF
ncbi:MAG: DNA-processing protein DprA [bacterium]|nr:DNA-processing protein DprA [bacterium]